MPGESMKALAAFLGGIVVTLLGLVVFQRYS